MDFMAFIRRNLFPQIPPERFALGDDITVKPEVKWGVFDAMDGHLINPNTNGPKRGEIVQVQTYVGVAFNRHVITVSKYDGLWFEDLFDPIITDKQLEELLESLDQEMSWKGPYQPE